MEIVKPIDQISLLMLLFNATLQVAWSGLGLFIITYKYV